jgi:hypothetical protein
VVDLQTVSDDVTQYFSKGHRFFKTGDHGEVMYITHRLRKLDELL